MGYKIQKGIFWDHPSYTKDLNPLVRKTGVDEVHESCPQRSNMWKIVIWNMCNDDWNTHIEGGQIDVLLGRANIKNLAVLHLDNWLYFSPFWRLTHATPAALYAHSASRDWECDAFMSKATGHVLQHEEDPDPELVWDIARQLVHRNPGAH